MPILPPARHIPTRSEGQTEITWANGSDSLGGMEEIADVPSPIDLREMRSARAWAQTAMEKRPWRKEFFETFDCLLAALGPSPSVLELGSGPGFLAQQVLQSIPSAQYTALDFSAAMHALAQERLGPVAAQVQFVLGNFKEADWMSSLGRFQAIVTLQAVHELRHKRHASRLFAQVKSLLVPGGIFLMCDHYAGPGGMADQDLYMSIEEQEAALRTGGLGKITLRLRKGGLALWKAEN